MPEAKVRIGINAHCLEGNRRGVGRYLTNILREWLINPNHDEYYLYYRDKIQQDPFLHNRRVVQRVTASFLGRRPLLLWQNASLPYRALADKVNIFFSPAYVLPAISPFKTVVTQHDISYELFPAHFHWGHKANVKFFSRHSARISGAILTISEFSKKEIMRIYNVPSEKIIVTYLDCDPGIHAIRDINEIKRFKNEFNLADQYILFVGTMFKRRNVDAVVKAFNLISARVSSISLVLIGDIPVQERDRLSKLFQASPFYDQIMHFASVTEAELRLFYNGAALLVYPSSYEGFGLPVLEAMRCGTPVIVSKSGSLPEVAGDAGTYVDPKDPADIAENIIRIVTNSSKRAELSNKVLRQSNKFSWARCAEKTRETLRTVVYS